MKTNRKRIKRLEEKLLFLREINQDLINRVTELKVQIPEVEGNVEGIFDFLGLIRRNEPSKTYLAKDTRAPQEVKTKWTKRRSTD